MEVKPMGSTHELLSKLRILSGVEAVSYTHLNGRGSLTVHFYSDEQLTAFANLLGGYQKETI